LILEDVKFEKLLRTKLKPSKLRYTTAMICLDLKEPWTMMEDLQTWLELLQTVSSDLMQELPMQEQDELRARVADAVGKYEEPADNDQTPKANGDAGGGGMVKCNLGIPLVVAVMRADGASSLETQKTLGWSETIEVHLRSECLAYGAALIYTMVQAKNNTNLDALYDYIMHRMYDYPLRRKANFPSRDALYLPSGWDSLDKVDHSAASLEGGLDRSFASVIVAPQAASATHSVEECEDMQAFLKRASGLLQNLGGTSASRQRPVTTLDANSVAGVGGGQRPSRRITERPNDGQPGGGPNSIGTATDNQSLQNFFQNLLNRNTPGAGQPTGGSMALPLRSKASSSALVAPTTSPQAPPSASLQAPPSAPASTAQAPAAQAPAAQPAADAAVPKPAADAAVPKAA